MKINHVITGCALAAGLMAFTPFQLSAGGFTDTNGALYAPMNIQMKITYVATNHNKTMFKTATITSKQVLTDLGFNDNVTLAVGPGVTNDSPPSIYVINTKSKTVMADLTAQGRMVLGIDNLISTDSPNNKGASQYAEQGIITLHFHNNITNAESSAVVFDLRGNYSVNDSLSATNKDGTQNESLKFNAQALSGQGVDKSINSQTNLFTGSLSGNGSGKVPAEANVVN